MSNIQKTKAAIKELQKSSTDYSVKAIAERLNCKCFNSTLIFKEEVIGLVKVAWLEMGNEYARKGQWEIDPQSATKNFDLALIQKWGL